MSFSKCATFPPASRLEAVGIFHLTASHCVLWKGRQHEWNRGIHTQLCGTIIGIVPHSCILNAPVSFIMPSFSKWGQLCFCHSMGRRQMKKIPLLQACLRGKSSTFWKWHCLRKIALESKRLIHTWWTWCQITWKRIFYPIQQKSMVFNPECRWNNGSKSLHSFWATPYSKIKSASCSSVG